LRPAGLLGGEGEGYAYITEVRRGMIAADVEVCWQVGNAGMQLFMAGADSAEILLGLSPGNPPTERRTTLINRRHVSTTAYLSLFSPYERRPSVTAVRWSGRDLLTTGWAGCTVYLADRHERWLLTLTPDAAREVQGGVGRPPAQFAYCLQTCECAEA